MVPTVRKEGDVFHCVAGSRRAISAGSEQRDLAQRFVNLTFLGEYRAELAREGFRDISCF
jgi:hypothetical protein